MEQNIELYTLMQHHLLETIDSIYQEIKTITADLQSTCTRAKYQLNF